jgi:hypothetical protein
VGEAAAMNPILPPSLVAEAFQPPLIAFLLSLVLSGLLALAGRPRAAGLGAAVGLAAALFLVFGVRMVTPRMLPERLPWLVLAAGLGGLAGDLVGARAWVAGILSAMTALGGAWFILGAPRVVPDLWRIAAEALPVLVAFAVPLWRLVPPRAGAGAAASALAAAGLLAAGLWAGGSAAVFPGLAASAAAAAGGLMLAGAVRGAGAGLAGALALAAAIGGVAAAAGLAQRSLAVWAGCLAPLVGLLVGPRAAGLLALAPASVMGAIAGPVLAGLPFAALALMLAGR